MECCAWTCALLALFSDHNSPEYGWAKLVVHLVHGWTFYPQGSILGNARIVPEPMAMHVVALMVFAHRFLPYCGVNTMLFLSYTLQTAYYCPGMRRFLTFCLLLEDMQTRGIEWDNPCLKGAAPLIALRVISLGAPTVFQEIGLQTMEEFRCLATIVVVHVALWGFHYVERASRRIADVNTRDFVMRW